MADLPNLPETTNTPNDVDFLKSLVFDHNQKGECTVTIDTTANKLKRKRFKVDSELLNGENGFKKLYEKFKEINFVQGSDNIKTNIKILMNTIMAWQYKLCPNVTFEDFIDKLDYLNYRKVDALTICQEVVKDNISEDSEEIVMKKKKKVFLEQ